jgi:hypothetical protein
MMQAKLRQAPRLPRELLPSLDPKVEEIIMHAIEREPRERYATAKDMLDELRNPDAVVIRDRSASQQPYLLDRLYIPRRILGPAVLVLVLGTLFVLTLRTGRSAPHRPPTPMPRPDPSASSGR